MIHRIALLLLLVAPCVVSAASPLAVSEIRARLFLNHSGTFSEPITDKMVLWNAIIGESGIKEPSNSTLVEVIVHGDPGSFKAGAYVDFIANRKTDGKLITNRRGQIEVLSKTGKYSIGFWLQATGCEPLHLTARVHGTAKVVQMDIPFQCGE